MNWLALVQLLFTLFGPVIEEWLKALFGASGSAEDATLDTPYPIETPAAITEWFAAARSKTSWYQLWKRARLALLERVAMRYVGEIAAAMRFGAAAPVLSTADRREIAARF